LTGGSDASARRARPRSLRAPKAPPAPLTADAPGCCIFCGGLVKGRRTIASEMAQTSFRVRDVMKEKIEAARAAGADEGAV
jgi:hypothetical protein